MTRLPFSMKPQKDHSTGNSGSSAVGHTSLSVNGGLVNGYEIGTILQRLVANLKSSTVVADSATTVVFVEAIAINVRKGCIRVLTPQPL